MSHNTHAAFAASLSSASYGTLHATREDLLRRLGDGCESDNEPYITHIKERLALVNQEMLNRPRHDSF